MSHAPNDYALVIGVDHYPNWAAGKKSLQGPSKDAQAFRDWLLSDQGGGLDECNARLIVSSKRPLAPLKQRIDKELRAIRALSKGKTRRRFYFYFSGHGHSPAMTGGQQALCLANWSMDDQRAALDLDSYVNTTIGCMKFEEGLFFLDCCRVRAQVLPGIGSELECGDPQYKGRHHAILFATDHYASGYEGPVGDEIRGYFTQALLSILQWQTIELQDLARRLHDLVPALADPKEQEARMAAYVARKIFLGPPVAGDTGSDSLPPLPTEPRGPRGRVIVNLTTNLSRAPQAQDEPSPPPPGTITLLQGHEVIATGQGQLIAEAPLGSYTVVVRHGEAVANHGLELIGDLEVELPLPRRVSAAPLSSTADKHEWITEPVVQASRWKASRGQQAVFVAHWSRDRMGPVPINGRLTLYGADGGSFEMENGLALQPIPAGTCLLGYGSPDTASPEIGSADALFLAVPVAKGWDTQIFIVEENGRPRLERASIFMLPAGKGFDPADTLLDAYERAVADLVTDGPGPDSNTLASLLYGKWRNPLFGLVGAYFLTRRMSRAGVPDEGDRHMLDTVISNLRKLLGNDSSDVAALEVLRATLAGEPPPPLYLGEGLLDRRQPPLFRVGMDALIEGSAAQPNLLGPDFDRIALGLKAGSPWSCWDPGRALLSQSEMKALKETVVRRQSMRDPSTSGYLRELHIEQLRRLVPDWLVAVARDEIIRARRSRRQPDSAKLIRRARMPRRVCEAAMNVARYAEDETAASLGPQLLVDEDGVPEEGWVLDEPAEQGWTLDEGTVGEEPDSAKRGQSEERSEDEKPIEEGA
jgi:hypothetical protein